MMPSNKHVHQKILDTKVGLKVWMFPLHYVKHHDHITFPCKKISVGHDTPRAHPSPSYPHTVHHQLTYEEDNTIDNHSSEDDILACHLPSITEEEDDDIKHFPTISLNDDFWMEEPVPERHLCIYEDSQHDFCTYPCPWLEPATPH